MIDSTKSDPKVDSSAIAYGIELGRCLENLDHRLWLALRHGDSADDVCFRLAQGRAELRKAVRAVDMMISAIHSGSKKEHGGIVSIVERSFPDPGRINQAS